jgi:hypothetical protein
MVFIKGHTYKRPKQYTEEPCVQCGKPFKRAVFAHRKFCDFKCYSLNKKGKPHFHGDKISRALMGKPKSPEHIKAVSNANRGSKRPSLQGEKNKAWKGDDVGYAGLHDWVEDRLGKPKKCFHCGLKGEKVKGKWNIHLANVSGEYKRDIRDWFGLCRKCHFHYDKNKKKRMYFDGKKTYLILKDGSMKS